MTSHRLGIFGGTFDPIHNGHLVAASEIAKDLNLDKIYFVPTGISWQKDSVTAGDLRLQMVKLAIANHPAFAISSIDIDRNGPTHTRDTLLEFRADYPEAELFFIAGADAMSGIETWKHNEELPKLAEFIAITRPGFTFQPPKSAQWSGDSAINYMEIPAMSISSTEIRAKVKAGISIQGLVPDVVSSFIAKHNLYQESK